MRQISLKIAFIRVGLLIFCMSQILRPQQQIEAQSKPIIVYDSYSTNVKWSDDGDILTFSSGHIPSILGADYTDLENWYEYDTSNEILTARRSWSLNPDLTSAEQKWLQLDDWDEGIYVFASPNNRFLLYPGAVTVGQDSFYIDLMVADRQNHQTAPTGGNIYDVQSGPDAFDVVWNTSGNSLVTRPQADWELVTGVYMSGFQDGLSHLVSRTDLDEINVQSQKYYSSVFHDVADNDRYILLDAILDQPTPSELDRYLIVFDVNDTTKSVVLPNLDARKVAGAMFVPGDDTQVVFVNETGLVEMKWATGKSVMLDSSITSADMKRDGAYFSQNGKWLAYIGNLGGIYLWNIQNALLTSTPTSP